MTLRARRLTGQICAVHARLRVQLEWVHDLAQQYHNPVKFQRVHAEYPGDRRVGIEEQGQLGPQGLRRVHVHCGKWNQM